MQSKTLEFGQDARGKMLEGVRQLAKAVKCTLGPRGRNVIIQQKGMPPRITKDGVSVAQEIFLKDPYEDMGAQALKQVAAQTNDVAGDGTTTATVLAEEIFSAGIKSVVAGHDPMSLKRGIDRASIELTKKLQEQSKEVSDNSEIRQVATISANGDQSIGNIIADAMDKVGKDGIVTLEESSVSRESSLRVTTGFEFDRGYLHAAFCNDMERQRVVLDDPYVWLINGSVSTGNHMQDMFPILEFCNREDKPLLIIAENIENEALAALVVNKLRGTLKIAAVRAPGFGSSRQEMLKDLAVLTGARLRDPTAGEPMLGDPDTDPLSHDELGTARQVVITKESTVVVGMDGCEEAIEKRVKEIRAVLNDETSAWDRERIEKRLAKLLGGVAVIEVGAASEVEMKERKDRFEDALAATRAAVQEGIIPGGGVALARAAKALKDFKIDNPEEQLGVSLMLNAATAPLRQIVSNAGESGDVILNKVQEAKPGWGFDAAALDMADMFKVGIVDPTKVSRVALENAVSVSSVLLTTECAIAFDDEDSDAAEGMMM